MEILPLYWGHVEEMLSAIVLNVLMLNDIILNFKNVEEMLSAIVLNFKKSVDCMKKNIFDFMWWSL